MSPLSTIRVIVIDDNAAIHQDFIKVLSPQVSSGMADSLATEIFGEQKSFKVDMPDFVVDTAFQGQEGLDKIVKARDEGNPYALAFVDIRMPPGWDGIETIKHIWQADPDIQIVICTAYSDYSWEDTIMHLGVKDNFLILKKPFDNVAVRQMACALTKKWQLQQETRKYAEYLEQRIQERTNSLEHSLSVIKATFESSTDGILVVDMNNKIVNYNNKFQQMWQISESILNSKDNMYVFQYILKTILFPENFLLRMQELFKNSEMVSCDILKFPDGRIFEYYTQPHKLEDKTIGRVWSFRNVTNRVRLENKLQHQATHDTLTDLPNRNLLVEKLQQVITQANLNQKMVGILFLDLDRFKLINDSLSHQAGDELLKLAAKRLLRVIRSEDTLARLGGDEFIMIAAQMKNEDDLCNIANKLLEQFQQPFEINHQSVSVSTSIGIAVYPIDGKTVDELLKNADLAMYHAKEMGKNQYQFYKTILGMNGLDKLEKENDLHKALANNEFFLCYQPQYDMATGYFSSVEALVRWQHPTKGIINPLDFIPLAEETGLIVPLGDWILKTACEQNKKWQDKGFRPIRMAVNITNYQCRQSDFVSKVCKILDETQLDPKYLELELTENVIINNVEIIDMVSELKEIGVQIVLDDFGTGNSTINYLRKIPINGLKIDQSFVKNININPGDEVIIKAIISMAKGLDLKVYAEGVETVKQLKYLQEQQCGLVQGFYFSKPLMTEELEKIFANSVT